MNIFSRFRPISTFVFDIDGVLTDGTLLVLNDAQMARRMNIKDGYALQLAVKKGYKVVMISGGNSEPLRDRLQKLGITDVFMQVDNKEKVLSAYVRENGLSWDQILFMGDDIPDYACMQLAGLCCCPSDSAPEVKHISQYICAHAGGEGCAREVIEKVLKLNGHWNADTTSAAL